MDAPVASRQSIIVGEVHASRSPAIISTVLGSCIATCLFDPAARIGGMNHFMLPSATKDTASAAYGIHAMELLINRMMQLGGDRRRFQAKLFGGASVLPLKSSDLQVGEHNVAFALEFLAAEHIPLIAKRLGGNTGVQVLFESHTGKALVKTLPARALGNTARREVQYLRSVQKPAAAQRDAVTLF